MNLEITKADNMFKVFLQITDRLEIFFYFDYGFENIVWKIGPEFIIIDDLVSFSLSLINAGIVIGYNRDLLFDKKCSCCGKSLNEDCDEHEDK